jgi:hypothetical protein
MHDLVENHKNLLISKNSFKMKFLKIFDTIYDICKKIQIYPKIYIRVCLEITRGFLTPI